MANPGGSGSTRLTAVLLLATVLVTNGDGNFPALIIFGDSTVDVGTNNYLPTLVKSNFRPYGRDLRFHDKASGRFSNGLIVPDFIAHYIGLPYPLAYLNPAAEGAKLLHGVNFASSGSGWINSTAELFFVRPFAQQVQDFKDYKSKLIELVGPSQAADTLSNALYIISTGGNDYINNYFLNPFERIKYTVQEWQDLITAAASQYIQDIYNTGARKIVIDSVPAIGCVPLAIGLYGNGGDGCVGYMNDAVAGANTALQSLLPNLEQKLPGLKMLYIDSYTTLVKAFQDPSAYGFEETHTACCGTGKIEVAVLCNADSPGTCTNASRYLFFDILHGSQTFYAMFAKQAYQQLLAAAF